jgi:hypothetical protein
MGTFVDVGLLGCNIVWICRYTASPCDVMTYLPAGLQPRGPNSGIFSAVSASDVIFVCYVCRMYRIHF